MTDERQTDLDSTESTASDPYEFIYKAEEWVWEKLRSKGLSDEQVWDLVVHENTYWGYRPLPEDEETHYCVLLILEIHELYEKLDDENFSQSARDWLLAGYLFASARVLAGADSFGARLISERQSKIAKKPRLRTTVAIRTIECILRTAPNRKLDSAQQRGQDLDRFRNYVRDGERVIGGGVDVEVTPIEDDDGKIIAYDFFDNKTNERNRVKEGSIRGIIHRLGTKRRPPK